jgi:hypothetical protein
MRNKVSRAHALLGPEGFDQPAPRGPVQPARHHPATRQGRPAGRYQRNTRGSTWCSLIIVKWLKE